MNKQETLEEATKERLIKHNLPVDEDFGEGYIIGSIFGAKWQQEQDKNKYSEEEVYIMIGKAIKENGYKQLNFFDESYYNDILVDWFEQNKKK
jgi:hypothetical protein